MSLCIALLSGPLDHKVMSNWTSTDVFEDYILHVQQLQDVDPSGGQLQAKPFLIPDCIDVKQICGLAIVNCETRAVEPQWGFQINPALGISCLEDGQNILCITGFCDNPKTADEYESDCSILDDPCALYKELRCCWLKLIKEKCKVSVSFRDRSVRYQPLSEFDKQELRREMLEAKAACDECTGEPNFWRGGHLGHSCVRTQRRHGGCCGR